jgi:hypothetical protein
MNELTIITALKKLGFQAGWAASENGIILWENEEPQPTEKELKAAGWVKPTPISEA